MNMIEGTEVVQLTPIGGDGFKWNKETRGKGWMTGYFAIVRGWRISVFAIHDGTYACQVEEKYLDDYNFSFARSLNAQRLLRYLLEYEENDIEDLDCDAVSIMRSGANPFWKRMSLTKVAYKIVKGNATTGRKRMLESILSIVEGIDCGDEESRLVDLIGCGDAVDFVLGEE